MKVALINIVAMPICNVTLRKCQSQVLFNTRIIKMNIIKKVSKLNIGRKLTLGFCWLYWRHWLYQSLLPSVF